MLFGREKLVFLRTNKLAAHKSHRLVTAYFPENVAYVVGIRCLLTVFLFSIVFIVFFEIHPTMFFEIRPTWLFLRSS